MIQQGWWVNNLKHTIMKKPNVQLIKIGRAFLGTVDLELKIGRMRKSQDFTVYPISKGDKSIIIQSDTRIGRVTTDGVGMVSKSHASGANFHHLSMDTPTVFEFETSDWNEIKKAIGLTSPEGDSKGIVIKNEGATNFATA